MNREIANFCRHLSFGVCVIGVADKRSHDAFTACSVMQASYEPLLLAVSVNPEHSSYPLLRTTRSFSVNVLRKDEPDVTRHFGDGSGLEPDKLKNVSWTRGESGAPILDAAMAWFECELTAVMPAGDHQIVLGRVVGSRIADSEPMAMLYADAERLDGSRRLYQESYF